MLEGIVVAAHADQDFPGFLEHEWEPVNKYVALKELEEFTPNRMPWPSSMLPMVMPLHGLIEGANAHRIFVGTSHESAIEWASKFEHKATAVPTPSIQIEILNCIVARPHEGIKLGSKLGIAVFLFALVVYFVGGVLIINPVVAFFGVLGCSVFWVMATVDKRLYHRKR